MYDVFLFVRANGRCPTREYIDGVIRSGRRSDAARIENQILQLRQVGSQQLVRTRRAEKMNDVWQLRSGRHRLFYFWDDILNRYVLLNGFLKQSRQTPRNELRMAERLRAAYFQALRANGG